MVARHFLLNYSQHFNYATNILPFARAYVINAAFGLTYQVSNSMDTTIANTANYYAVFCTVGDVIGLRIRNTTSTAAVKVINNNLVVAKINPY